MGPLAGIRVLDLSRMLPGAVLARRLMDWGAELTKVEGPEGDPLRLCPPWVAGGVGAGFAHFYAGAQFREADWRGAEGRVQLRAWALASDVLIDSFRTGTMASLGLDGPSLRAEAPGLITLGLPAYAPEAGPDAVGHDLDVAAASGLLRGLGGGMPSVQVVDAATGQVAAGEVAAALLKRARTGQGEDLVVPLALGAAALRGWAAADEAAGGFSFRAEVLSGQAPAYRLYPTAEGGQVAIACVEPKFWALLLQRLGLGEAHLPLGMVVGPEAQATHEAVGQALLARPWAEWAASGLGQGLPLAWVR